jgi:membrane-bound serine protease (ClpP class)
VPRLAIVLLFLLVSGSLFGRVRGDAGSPTAAEDGGSAPSPSSGGAQHAPYHPRPSEHGKQPRVFKIDGKTGAAVIRLPLEGMVDLGLLAFLRRALEQHGDATALLLDINTLGGRVDAAIQMRDALLHSKVKTIAYVNPRAISAGALIALACDVIVVAPGASIGAATPVQLGADGAEPVAEKMVSYFRTEMRSTAEAKGRRGDLAEAMVDASVEIPGLDSADKLLTLDTEGALTWGIADARADGIDGVLRAVGLEGAKVKEASENWAERLVRFLTDPVVTGLLMSLGTLGLLIELYHPGLGLPGAIGVLFLSLFFGGHLLVHLAGLEELIVFTFGIGLFALELFVIPGFGITGVLGILCIVVALMLTMIGLPIDVLLRTGAWVEPLTRVGVALLMTVVGLVVAARFLPRSRAMRGLILHSTLASNVRAEGPSSFVSADETRFLGQLGVAESDLRPSGVARFGDARVDVVSEGGYVAAGTAVRVLEVEGGRIVVRPEVEVA